jgi:hypothetical protein
MPYKDYICIRLLIAIYKTDGISWQPGSLDITAVIFYAGDQNRLESRLPLQQMPVACYSIGGWSLNGTLDIVHTTDGAVVECV